MFGAMSHALKFTYETIQLRVRSALAPTPRTHRSLLLLTRSITLLTANIFVVLVVDFVFVTTCVFVVVLFVLESHAKCFSLHCYGKCRTANQTVVCVRKNSQLLAV